MAQTLTEIDYETVIDDEDVVDEFLLFKNTLHSETAVYILIVAVYVTSYLILIPLCSE